MTDTGAAGRAPGRPKPARIPLVDKVDHFVAHGDRSTYSLDEGLS